MSTPTLLRAARKASPKRFAVETPSAFTAFDEFVDKAVVASFSSVSPQATPDPVTGTTPARDIHITEHEALLHQLGTLYAQAYGVSLAIAALPSTDVADAANERLGNALVGIEDCQSIMRGYFWPERT